MNGYRCIACADTQTADFADFLCPACGGNLEITYNYAEITKNVAQGLDDGNDIFRFAPFLPVAKLDTPFPLRVGATPLYAAPRLGESLGLRNLYLKDDTLNPSASIKDRASAVALQRAIDVGAKTVAVASTGNAGSSTACLAAGLGMRAVIFVPESAPQAKLAQSLAYGATVLAVRGNYDDAFDLCLAASVEFGWFNRSTGYNPFTREGKKTCAYEIWEALNGWVPDRVVVPAGDGNILSGMWKGWCDLQAVGLIDHVPKIDCAQSAASAAISHTVRRIRDNGDTEPDWSSVRVDEVTATTLADSISVNRPRDGLAAVKAIVQSGGEAIAVADEEILAAIPEIARSSGIFAEPAAAAPWAAVQQMVRDEKINANELIVCLVSGSGLKDVGNAQACSGTPLIIDPSIEAVREKLT
ncbi:MAG: threonine synthase [Gammaproteobacteria bacterium]|nr:threonine synthase [Gammaproteobacteria bacterium]MDH3749414.1 threonine synthase [Gammaproteobacteria bacterium]MDH3804120.1 threonine synthase [Gammaproteobacteria bacterium]